MWSDAEDKSTSYGHLSLVRVNKDTCSAHGEDLRSSRGAYRQKGIHCYGLRSYRRPFPILPCIYQASIALKSVSGTATRTCSWLVVRRIGDASNPGPAAERVTCTACQQSMRYTRPGKRASCAFCNIVLMAGSVLGAAQLALQAFATAAQKAWPTVHHRSMMKPTPSCWRSQP